MFDGSSTARARILSAEVIHVMPDATYAEVLAGPEEADGYNWYRISSSEFGTGWAVGAFLMRG